MQIVSGTLSPDDTTVEISSTGKLQVKDGGLGASKISGIVGDAVAKAIDTVYQAATDGFLSFIGDVDNGDDFVIYSDANTPPTTARQRLETGSGTTAFKASMAYLVKKGHYYKFSKDGGTLSAGTMFFIPIGS